MPAPAAAVAGRAARTALLGAGLALAACRADSGPPRDAAAGTTAAARAGTSGSSRVAAAARPARTPLLRDDFGDTVDAPRTTDGARTAPAVVAAPARIVSLMPATTEMLFALGAGGRLVGRTRWDAWPDSARRVPDLGDGIRPNVEAVLAARPDLVVLYASADNRAAARRLRAAGVRTVALKIDRVADFYRAVALLGIVTGDTLRARLVADSVRGTLDRVRRATARLRRPTVFWHVWDNPLITIGSGSYMSELVEIAGGRNAYDALAEASPQVSFEDLLRRDPDVILAGPEGARAIAAGAAWRPLRAVRDGRVLVVDTALVGRPSVRLGEAARALADLLHPGAVR